MLKVLKGAWSGISANAEAVLTRSCLHLSTSTVPPTSNNNRQPAPETRQRDCVWICACQNLQLHLLNAAKASKYNGKSVGCEARCRIQNRSASKLEGGAFAHDVASASSDLPKPHARLVIWRSEGGFVTTPSPGLPQRFSEISGTLQRWMIQQKAK